MAKRLKTLLSGTFFTWRRYDVIIAATIACIVIIIGFYILVPLDSSAAFERINIPKGTGLYQVASLLSAQHLIRSRFLFIAYVTLSGERDTLKYGNYHLSSSMSIYDIANKIAGGKADPTDIGIVIPEGFNVWQIDKTLANNGLIKEGQFASLAYRDEGSFFPDTYRFDPHSDPDEIIQKLKDTFALKTPTLNERGLIIASILEKEARRGEDMEIVAGIINNRLKLGMPLQVDATVMYGACLRIEKANNFAHDCDTTNIGVGRELHIDGPYNSYTRAGLPAGPISNPGLDAINAALHPRQTAYLYYLSDHQGAMHYAKTGAEHNANRLKYLGF